MRQYSNNLKFVSSLLLYTFLFQQISYANPDIKPLAIRLDENKLKASFTLPASVATIEDSWKSQAKDAKTIILLQDAHTNDSGQINLAHALEIILNSEKSIRTVFVEGALGDNSLSSLKSETSLDKRKEVSMAYIRKGLLHGDEYLNLTSDRAFTIWGVENLEAYTESLEIYKKVAASREKFQLYLSSIDQTINTLKQTTLNPALFKFYEKVEAFKNEKTALTDYFDSLLVQSQSLNIPLENYPHLKGLKKLKDKEASIDFKKANDDEQKAIQSFSKEDQQELKELAENIARSPFKIGSEEKKEDKAFYSFLEEKLAKNHSLENYSELAKYFDYLKIAKTIDIKALLKELDSLGEAVVNSLSMSQDEKDLIHCAQTTRYLHKLFNLTLTPEDYSDYKALTSNFPINKLTGFLNKKIMGLKKYYERAVFLEEGYEDIVKESESFYELTFKRDTHFIEEAVSKMNAENQSKAMLITGGFHAANLKSLLKKNNISYISVVPQVFHETNQKRYEAILLNQTMGQPKASYSQSAYGTIRTPAVASDGVSFPAIYIDKTLLKNVIADALKAEHMPPFIGTTNPVTPVRKPSAEPIPVRQESEYALAGSRLTAKQPISDDDFVQVAVPQGYAAQLHRNPYNLIPKTINILPLDTDNKTASTVLEDRLAQLVVAGSSSQAISSVLFAGLGKEIKEVADGQAMHFTERSIQEFVEENQDTAIVILADEGVKDGSYSLSPGSLYIYDKDFLEVREIKYTGMKSLIDKMKELRDKGIKILRYAGDGLDNTNGFVPLDSANTPGNSMALFSIFEEVASNPETWLDGEHLHLIDDNFRMGGISYSAPEDAGVTPFDLPSIALEKIISVHSKEEGIDPTSAKYVLFHDEFLNNTTIMTLGPREKDVAKENEKGSKSHRHQKILDDAAKLQESYPGLKIAKPGDGDLLPRAMALIGEGLSGRHLIVFGRSGAPEAISTAIIAADRQQAQQALTMVSESATANDYSGTPAYQYTDIERGLFKHYGLSNSVTTAVRGKRSVVDRGVFAITSVTGASSDIYGENFAHYFDRVRFNSEAGLKNGTISTYTLLVHTTGSFIVRTTFESQDIQRSKIAILAASAPARHYVDTLVADLRAILTATELKYLDRAIASYHAGRVKGAAFALNQIHSDPNSQKSKLIDKLRLFIVNEAGLGARLAESQLIQEGDSAKPIASEQGSENVKDLSSQVSAEKIRRLWGEFTRVQQTMLYSQGNEKEILAVQYTRIKDDLRKLGEKMDGSRLSLQEKIQKIQARWDAQKANGRIIKRLHTAEAVAKLQPNIFNDLNVQNHIANKAYTKLREHQAAKTAINTTGAFNESSLDAMARAGIEMNYLGGWAESYRDGTSDQARYPYTRVSETLARYSRYLWEHQNNQAEARSRMTPDQLAKTPEVDFLVPFFVDIDTGHLAAQQLTEYFMSNGYGSAMPLIAALHIEDQAQGCKKCGHMAGKVLVSTDAHIKRINEVRFVLDTMGLDTMIAARTDAEAAEFITSNLDERDHPFILGVTNPSVGAYYQTIANARAQGIPESEVEKIHKKWKADAGLMTFEDAIAKALEKIGRPTQEWRSFAKTASNEAAKAKAKELGVNVYNASEWKLLESKGMVLDLVPVKLFAGVPQEANIFWDWDLPTTQEQGYQYYMIQSGTEMAIARSKAFLPYADIAWMEQHHPSVDQVKEWADALKIEAKHLGMPEPLLANNTSPSFNWNAAHEGRVMSDEDLETFLKRQGEAGVQFNFITYGGSEIDHRSMEKFLNGEDGFLNKGMLAWARFQKEALGAGNPFVRGSQGFAGVSLTAARDAAATGAKPVANALGEKDTMSQFAQTPEKKDGARLAEISFREDEKVGNVQEAYNDLYTPKVLSVLKIMAPLTQEKNALMDKRYERRENRAKNREEIGFLHPNSYIPGTKILVRDARNGNYEGAPIPKDLQKQWVQGTGPGARPRADVKTSLRSVAYALLSGANGWMFDGEDALGQVDTMSLDNIRNLTLAIHKDPIFMEVAESLANELVKNGEEPAGFDWRARLDYTTKLYRTRGLHLEDRHTKIVIDGKEYAISGTIVDMVLYIVNNYERLLDDGSTPTFYLPKLQTAEEAAFMAKLMDTLEDSLEYKGKKLERGCIKAFVLIEQLEESFQLAEMRAVLGKHFVGFNTGRWDYINSVSDAKAWDEKFINPNIEEITMTYAYMANYEDRVRRAAYTPDRNGNTVHWIGGMEPNIPVGSKEGVEAAMKKAYAGGKREFEAGAGGKWVASPKMVKLIQGIWAEGFAGQTNSDGTPKVNNLEMKVKPLTYTAKDAAGLTELTEAPRTIRGARNLLSVGMQYGNAFERGFAAAALKPADFFGNDSILYLMEDAATGEIRLSILHEWVHKKAIITEDDAELGVKAGDVFTEEIFKKLLEQEYQKLLNADNKDVHNDSKKTTLPIARQIVESYVLDPVKYAWYIDLLNIALNVSDLDEATRRINLYTDTWKSTGKRITENLDFDLAISGARLATLKQMLDLAKPYLTWGEIKDHEDRLSYAKTVSDLERFQRSLLFDLEQVFRKKIGLKEQDSLPHQINIGDSYVSVDLTTAEDAVQTLNILQEKSKTFAAALLRLIKGAKPYVSSQEFKQLTSVADAAKTIPAQRLVEANVLEALKLAILTKTGASENYRDITIGEEKVLIRAENSVEALGVLSNIDNAIEKFKGTSTPATGARLASLRSLEDKNVWTFADIVLFVQLAKTVEKIDPDEGMRRTGTSVYKVNGLSHNAQITFRPEPDNFLYFKFTGTHSLIGGGFSTEVKRSPGIASTFEQSANLNALLQHLEEQSRSGARLAMSETLLQLIRDIQAITHKMTYDYPADQRNDTSATMLAFDLQVGLALAKLQQNDVAGALSLFEEIKNDLVEATRKFFGLYMRNPANGEKALGLKGSSATPFMRGLADLPQKVNQVIEELDKSGARLATEYAALNSPLQKLAQQIHYTASTLVPMLSVINVPIQVIFKGKVISQVYTSEFRKLRGAKNYYPNQLGPVAVKALQPVVDANPNTVFNVRYDRDKIYIDQVPMLSVVKTDKTQISEPYIEGVAPKLSKDNTYMGSRLAQFDNLLNAIRTQYASNIRVVTEDDPDQAFALYSEIASNRKINAYGLSLKQISLFEGVLQELKVISNAGSRLSAADDGERTAATVTDEDFRELLRLREQGLAGFHKNIDLTPVVPASESAVLDWARLSEQEKQKFTEAQRDMFSRGEIAMIVMAGGEATRFGGPKTFVDVSPELGEFLQIKADNLRWLNQTFGTHVPLYVLSSEKRLAEFKKSLAERQYYGLSENDFLWYTQGTVDTFIPSDQEIEANFKGDDVAKNKTYAHNLRQANPDGIYRFNGEQRKIPAGHLDAIASFVISGRLSDAVNRGLKYAAVVNIDNLQALLKDDGVIAHFASTQKDFAFLLAEKNLTFTITDKTSGKTIIDKLIVRFRDNVISFDGLSEFKGQAEKDGYRFVINAAAKQVDVYESASGSLVETNQKIKPETGGTLVQPVDADGNPTGKPTMKEGFELKADFPHADAPFFNTNTILLNLGSLLKILGVTREELLQMTFEQRSQLVREKLVKTIKPNFEFKNHEVDGEYPQFGSAKDGKTKIPVSQLTRIMLQVAHIPDAAIEYYFLPRQQVFAPVKEPEDKAIAAANNRESLKGITLQEGASSSALTSPDDAERLAIRSALSLKLRALAAEKPDLSKETLGLAEKLTNKATLAVIQEAQQFLKDNSGSRLAEGKHDESAGLLVDARLANEDQQGVVLFVSNVVKETGKTGSLAVSADKRDYLLQVRLSEDRKTLYLEGLGEPIEIRDFKMLAAKEGKAQVSVTTQDLKLALDRADKATELLNQSGTENFYTKPALVYLPLDSWFNKDTVQAKDYLVPIFAAYLHKLHGARLGKTAGFVLQHENENQVKEILNFMALHYGDEEIFVFAENEKLPEYFNNAQKANVVAVHENSSSVVKLNERNLPVQALGQNEIPNFADVKLALFQARIDEIATNDPDFMTLKNVYQDMLGREISNLDELIKVLSGQVTALNALRQWALPPIVKVAVESAIQMYEMMKRMAEQAA